MAREEDLRLRFRALPPPPVPPPAPPPFVVGGRRNLGLARRPPLYMLVCEMGFRGKGVGQAAVARGVCVCGLAVWREGAPRAEAAGGGRSGEQEGHHAGK